jgi:hypothetical protein
VKETGNACECPAELPARDRCGDGWIRCDAGLCASSKRFGMARGEPDAAHYDELATLDPRGFVP